MYENDPKKEEAPVVQIVERRKHRDEELSSDEIMRLVRKRAARGTGKGPAGGSKGPERAG